MPFITNIQTHLTLLSSVLCPPFWKLDILDPSALLICACLASRLKSSGKDCDEEPFSLVVG